MVYVLSNGGKPLMPTMRHGKVRHMLKSGRAKVVKSKPFTIQLTYATTSYTQPVTLGIDAGYQTVGFSAVSDKQELISGECQLLAGQVERNKDRLMYRRQRRSRLRHRKARFNNRKKPDGWLAPSLLHKLESHLRLVRLIESLLPVTRIIIEVASFDIQAIKNPDIFGQGYQRGEQHGYWNLREYILHRDGHCCQNPSCSSESKELQMHHIGYWKGDATDRPGNLITLCIGCHRSGHHHRGGLLWGWEPKLKPFRAETFMTTVRWKMVNLLECEYTYGYITKSKRIELSLPKTHANDAFVIAGGSTQQRANPLEIRQVRRNNRSLQKFYDAKYVDTRTGKQSSGQELNNGCRTRNREHNGPNLRMFRGEKLSKGRVQIRRKRYPFQPGDTVIYDGRNYFVKGTQSYGAYVKLSGLPKPVKSGLLRHLYYGKGLCVSN